MTVPQLRTVSGDSQRLEVLPAADNLALLAPVVADVLREWVHVGEAGVVALDPDLADTAAMTEAFDLPLTASANCVLVAGKRDGVERVAACVVRADTRADVNGAVKRLLDVRKASFLPVDRATAEAQMEYGGITPVGVPSTWRVLVDARLLDEPVVILGAGVRAAKLVLPGRLLAQVPGVEVIDALAN